MRYKIVLVVLSAVVLPVVSCRKPQAQKNDCRVTGDWVSSQELTDQLIGVLWEGVSVMEGVGSVEDPMLLLMVKEVLSSARVSLTLGEDECVRLGFRMNALEVFEVLKMNEFLDLSYLLETVGVRGDVKWRQGETGDTIWFDYSGLHPDMTAVPEGLKGIVREAADSCVPPATEQPASQCYVVLRSLTERAFVVCGTPDDAGRLAEDVRSFVAEYSERSGRSVAETERMVGAVSDDIVSLLKSDVRFERPQDTIRYVQLDLKDLHEAVVFPLELEGL